MVWQQRVFVETEEILSSLNTAAPANVKVFSFGVGDDVDTTLLDSLVRDFRGTGSYVRPTERIDEEGRQPVQQNQCPCHAGHQSDD